MKLKLTLAVVFLLSLLIHVGAVYFVYSGGGLYLDDLTTMLGKLGTTYLTPLAVIAGGSLGNRRRLTTGGFALALLLALVWNLILIMRTVAFARAASDSVTEWSHHLEAVGSGYAFLVTGPLSYFFAKTTTEPPQPNGEEAPAVMLS